MRRTHVGMSAGPIIVEPRDQASKPALKPTGFWYEVNADWRRWCRSEMPDWLEGRYVHRVSLGDEGMLNIRTTSELDAFADEYKVTERVTSSFDGRPMDLELGIRWA